MVLGIEGILVRCLPICIWKPAARATKPEHPTSWVPHPDTCKSRGLKHLLVPWQGLRVSWHFPLILPNPDSPRVKQVLLAQAEAEKIRKIGEAEAAVIESMGKAEAERMKLKAEAYQKYGDAAKMALVLEALPQVRPTPQAEANWANVGTPLGLVRNTETGWLEGLSEGCWGEPCKRHRLIPGALGLSDHGLQLRATQAALGFGEVEEGEILARVGEWSQSTSQAVLPPPRLLPKSLLL